MRLLNTHPICQSTDDHVPGYKCSIPDLVGTKFRVQPVWAIWFIVWRWVWDCEMPGALVPDEMSLGKTFTSGAAAMICKLLTENVVKRLPQSILWGNTLQEWVNMALNNYPGIISEEWEWYLSQWHNSVPSHPIDIQTTPPYGHSVLTLALEPILLVTMPGVAETTKSVIDKMTYSTDFKLIDLFHVEIANLTHEDLNTSIDKPENRWHIQLVSYGTSPSGVKPSSNSQLSQCAWSFGIFDESHRYKTKNRVGWQIAMKAQIALKV